MSSSPGPATDHDAQFGGARDGVAVLAPDFRIRYANASLLEILELISPGRSVANLWDALPQWEHTPQADALRQAMRARTTVSFRVDRRAGGGRVWQVDAEPVAGGEMRVRLRNVTAEADLEALRRTVQAASAALADREQRLEALVRAAPVALLLLDAETLVALEVNEAYVALLDDPWRTPADVVGRAAFEFIPRMDELGVAALLARVRETGDEVQEDEFRFDGFRRGPAWFRLTLRAIPGAGGRRAAQIAVMAVEVTELVEGRRRVEAERRALFAVLDTLPVGVVVAEAPSGRITYTNRAAVELTGRPAEALAAGGPDEYAARWQALLPSGEPVPRAQSPLARALRGEETHEAELLLRRPDGSERTILASGVPLRDAAGRVERAMAAFYDVSDRLALERALVERTTQAEHAAAEAALRAEESRALREMGRALVSSLEPDHVLRLAAQNGMELVGARGAFIAAPLPGTPLMRVTPAVGTLEPLDGREVPIAGSAVERALTDGTQRFAHAADIPPTSALLEDARRLGIGPMLMVPMRAFGEMLGVLGVVDRDGGFGPEDARLLEAFADSAALGAHNARLYAEERRRAEVNRALVRAAEALTSTLDPAEVMERIVRLAEELVGAEGAGLTVVAGEEDEQVRMAVASGMLAPLAGVVGARHGSLSERVMAGGAPVILSAGGDAHPAMALLRGLGVEHHALVPLRAGDEALGVLGMVRSAARPPFAAEELEVIQVLGGQAALAVRNARLYEASQAASRAKSEFLAMMSHELRTPLNALEGYASLIEEGVYGPVTDAQRTALGRMRVARHGLVTLIDQVLDVARVEAGRKRVERAPVDLAALAKEQTDALSGTAEREGLAIRFTADALPPVRTDAGMVRQVLTNLLGNAVKFTERGTVSVHVGRQGGEAVVRVRDTGRGVPAEHLERIFEPFFQVDPSTTRREGGVGLGLALSREFARMLGGELEVESEPGNGSTFTLRLPLDPEDGG